MVKPLKIALIMQGSANWIGGIIYIQNAIKAIASLPEEQKQHIKVYLLVGRDLEENHYKNLRALVEEVYVCDCLTRSLINRIYWKLGRAIKRLKDIRLIKILEKKEIDFVYPVPVFSGTSWNFNCNWSTWIPDFQHKHLPSFSPERDRKNRDRIFNYIAKNSKNIVFSSNNALEDFLKFYPHSTANKFVLQFKTIPEQDWFKDDSSLLMVQKKYQLPDNFFIVSNQFWIHKNHKIIIDALILLKKQNVYPSIACTGKLYDYRFPQYAEEIKKLIKDNDIAEQFILLGLISRWEQIQLMRRSLAVIQPSLFEGWSTVVEDARVLGKVVVLSDIPVHREQNPPNAQFFNPNSSEELANRLKSLLVEFKPGPHLMTELEARKRNKIEAQSYGEQLLKIAQNTNSLFKKESDC
jgi:glycosyltransferase involved in cell wall biosynthesis